MQIAVSRLSLLLRCKFSAMTAAADQQLHSTSLGTSVAPAAPITPAALPQSSSRPRADRLVTNNALNFPCSCKIKPCNSAASTPETSVLIIRKAASNVRMQTLTRSACRTFLAPARSFTQHKRFATKMGLKSDHEDKLISLSKQFNKAFGQKDTSKLDGLLSPRVVLHADKVFITTCNWVACATFTVSAYPHGSALSGS